MDSCEMSESHRADRAWGISEMRRPVKMSAQSTIYSLVELSIAPETAFLHHG